LLLHLKKTIIRSKLQKTANEGINIDILKY